MRHVQLRAFHFVAVCGGFSKAARALNLTQPAVSDQVRRLEEEYEVLLFNRQHKQVTLTRTGARLLEITLRLFETENQARELLSETRALRTGALRIVADSVSHVSAILARFRRAYPGIELSVQAGNTQEIIRMLNDYEAELGVVGGLVEGRDFEVVALNATPLVAFVAREHPLAARGAMTLAELAGQPLVLRERGSRTRRSLEELAERRGLVLAPAIEAEGREAVREIVATGFGVGIVSEAEFDRRTDLVAIAISDCDIEMEESLICLRERAGGRLVRAFLDTARAHLQGRESVRSGQLAGPR